jgi:hypothetical protein
MPRSRLATIQIAASEKSLSKGQKTFNNQIQQIGKLRTTLAAWDTASTAYQAKHARELEPLLVTTSDLKLKLVHNLDRAERQKDLTRTERRMLQELIVDLAAEVLAERDDAEVKAMYNRHSRSDYESEEAAQLQAMKGAIEIVLGVDLGNDAGLNSPEELMQRARERFEEQQVDLEAERQAREERRAKKKSAKQLEKEARAEEDAQRINHSIRDIYRKLVRVLHPDRETDPEERIRKTGLMQRVNQAYDAQNLLQLLELQLELEHIDRNAIDTLDEERLRHYNAILKRQIAELNQELMYTEISFRARFDISPVVRVAPETVLRNLDKEIASVKQSNRQIEQDLARLDTVKGIKAWLKMLRRRPAADDFDDMMF